MRSLPTGRGSGRSSTTTGRSDNPGSPGGVAGTRPGAFSRRIDPMANGEAVSPRGPGARGALAPVARAPATVEFHYTQTDSFSALLKQLGASLAVTTYQANKLLVARAAGDGLSTLVRTF